MHAGPLCVAEAGAASDIQVDAEPACLTQDRADSEIKEATSEDYASVQLTLIPQAAASSGIWGEDHPASPPYQQPTDERMPEVQAHVTLGLVGQAATCAHVVIGADAGGAELDLSLGSLKITNHHKQVQGAADRAEVQHDLRCCIASSKPAYFLSAVSLHCTWQRCYNRFSMRSACHLQGRLLLYSANTSTCQPSMLCSR